jgi:ubiquinone biosynthesis protein
MIFNSSAFKNIKRMREIIMILVKYGFEDIIANSTLRNIVPERTRLSWMRQNNPALDYTRYERIRMAAEELGPTFVKLAQVVSNRPDMLPDELITELEKLQDKVPPFDSKKAKQIIEKETGLTIDQLFDEFQDKPMASASIGQVHKAKLKTGEWVVVKVQRPGVKDVIDLDLSILKEAVRRTERYLKREGVNNADDVVLAFERSMLKELDYENEARNLDKFKKTYESYKNFYIPKVYKEHSTSKVLIMEYVSGCKISDIKQLKAWGLKPESVAENGFNIYLTQIFEFGYFHADPHPGNVLVRQDGVICLLDFGMIGKLMPKDKYNFAGVFVSFARQDAKQMAYFMKKLSIEDEIHDMRQFEYDLSEIIDDFASLDMREGSLADMTQRLQKLMFVYQIKVPSGVFLVFRAFAILEGIGKQLYPNMQTYDYVKPFGFKLIKEQFKPKNILDELSFQFNQISSFVNTFPQEVRSIISKTTQGKLHFEVELQGYGYLLKKMDSVTNRMALTYIIMALIIGSSIIATANYPGIERTYFGLPVLSFFGFSGAGALSLILFYLILRIRKYK